MIVRPKAIYFIRPVGQTTPVKIGCSCLPAAYLTGLMHWSPVPLEIVATVPGEHDLARRIQGLFLSSLLHQKWFTVTPALQALIDGLRAGRPIADLIDLNAPIIKRRLQRNVSPSHQLRIRYVHRLRWAGVRAKPNSCDPADVDEIMSRWRGNTHPTVAELARLDEVIAEPHKHFLSYQARYAARASARQAPAPRRRAA